MTKRKKPSVDMIEVVRRVHEEIGIPKNISANMSADVIVKFIIRMTGGGKIKNLTKVQAGVLLQVALSRTPMNLSDAKSICPPANPSGYIDGTLKMSALARSVMRRGSPPLTAERVAAEIQNEFVQKRYLARFRDKDFYKTREWKELRLVVLSARRVCALCGSGPSNGKVLHVDHIKPRSIYPELSFSPDNLQVLCRDCNMTKSNVFQMSAA